jgi:hypothetical protein
MLGKLKKSEAGWYILYKSTKNVKFGEPLMVRYIVKDDKKRLLPLQDSDVHFELDNEQAIITEPNQTEMIYCYCGRTIKCDCSPLS